MEAFEGIKVEKLTPGEQLAVDRAEVCFVTDLSPVFGDGPDLVLDQRGGFRFFQVIVGRSSEQGGERAGAPIALDQHGLRGFVGCAPLRTDVIGGCQGQPLAIPEGGMVASMVVGVPAQHVEANPPVQLLERVLGVG